MADFTETIRVLIDTETSKFTAGVANVKQQIGQAETATGKLGAAAKGAGDILSAMPLPAVAGAAVGVGVALKNLGDKFQDAALNAKKLSDTTGLTVEKASRWQEVANDVGVSTDTLQSTFGKAVKAIGAAPEKFDALGVSVVRAKDGTIDMNATLLNAIGTINNIQDPTAKAALASQLFGKSWADLTPILSEGTDKIKANLAAVSDAKVITDGEVDSAKAWQASWDNINDTIDNLTLTVGKFIVDGANPTIAVLADMAQQASDLLDTLDGGTGVIQDVGSGFAFWLQNLSPLGESMRAFNALVSVAGPLFSTVSDAVSQLASDLEGPAVQAFNDLVDVAKKVIDVLSDIPGKLGDIADQIPGLSQVVADVSDAWDRFGGIVKAGWENFTPAGQVFRIVDAGGKTVNFLAGEVDGLKGSTDSAGKSAGSWGDEMKTQDETMNSFGRTLGEATSRVEHGADAQKAYGEVVKLTAEQTKELEQASKDYLKALQDLSKAQADQADALKATSDSQFAADKAARDAAQAFDDLGGKLDKINKDEQKGAIDSATAERERGQAVDDAAKSASDMADAQVALDAKNKLAVGSTQTHTGALDAWNASILTAAANADGPLRQAIINHIAAVNGIPPEKLTEILASTPNLEEQKRLIDEASAARKLTIEADANTDPATRAVNLFIQATENKTAYIDVVGRLSTQGQAFASGGSAKGLALVGEEGPELVDLPMGSYVYTAGQTRGMLAGMPAFADGGIVGPVTGGAPATSNLSATDRAQLIKDLDNALQALAAVDPADVAKVAKVTDQVAAIRARLHTSGVFTPPAGVGGPIIPGASQGLTFTTSELKALAGTPLSEMKDFPAPMYAPSGAAFTPPPGGSQYDSPYFQSDFWKPDQGRIPVQSPSEIAANRAKADSAALARADLARFGGTVINVYMPPGSDGEDVVRALKQWQRRNGTVPVITL